MAKAGVRVSKLLASGFCRRARHDYSYKNKEMINNDVRVSRLKTEAPKSGLIAYIRDEIVMTCLNCKEKQDRKHCFSKIGFDFNPAIPSICYHSELIDRVSSARLRSVASLSSHWRVRRLFKVVGSHPCWLYRTCGLDLGAGTNKPEVEPIYVYSKRE